MRASAILCFLNETKAQLSVRGDRLRFSPAHLATPEVREGLRRHKRKLMLLVLAATSPGVMEERLRRRGWCLMWAEEVGEYILIAAGKHVPRPYRGLVVYRPEEIRQLRDEKQQGKLTAEDLQILHAAKRAFRGSVVPLKWGGKSAGR